MAGSVVHDYRVALKAALAARPALSGVRVSYGPPLPRTPGEFIWLADAEEAPQVARALGRMKRREDAIVKVVVSVQRTGTDQEAVAARAYALLAEVENAIREDPSLDAHYTGAGELIHSQFAGLEEDRLLADDNKRECLIIANVSVAARI
jgi:hypothetical protein